VESRTAQIESIDDSATASTTLNIASYLPRMALSAPDRPAVFVTKSRDSDGRAIYASMTFAELEAESNRYANGLTKAGIERGMRVLVMVRPGFEFLALIFALFKMGTVPVMIDPGMGVGRMLDCIRKVDLRAFVGVPLAHVVRVLRPGAFKTVEHVVTVGKRWGWGGPTLSGLRAEAAADFDTVATDADEVAAILFTSGSTGPPKGVVYEHGMFNRQVHEIQAHYGIEPGEIDLPTFPLFALFNPAMGMTSVIPDMDPTRPARVDPAKIVEAIRDHGVTNTFGSPALWKRVSEYCVQRDIKLPTLRRILIAGAPVPWHVIEKLHSVLDRDADVHTPYGATESLPVASISGKEIFAGCSDMTRRGAGTCVGHPMPGIDLRIIRISDEPIAEWSDNLLVGDGKLGEIAVSGPVVTNEYYGLPHATALAKIRDGDRIWHRIGDIGYLDSQGRLWFCGRKAHRVVTESTTLYSVRCEAIFNEHPDVYRSALVGVGSIGRQQSVIVVEPLSGKLPTGRRATSFRNELLELGKANDLTRDIREILFHRSLPVDIRHNVKINREELAVWAAGRLR
jgi:acyl-CoA synthetase (AMP-forming)/AMP-acid ligase II